MIYKYGVDLDKDDGKALQSAGFERAVLANANRGGENVATGALIGAALGARIGFSKLPASLVENVGGPGNTAEIMREIDAFVARSPFAANSQHHHSSC